MNEARKRGLPRNLFTSQEGEGKKLSRTNVPLDPNTMGRESLELQANQRKRIVGQEEAIREIVSIYQMYLSGINAPGRPIGNLLFPGPTGSGKTRIVGATAESLVNNSLAVIKIDCAEFPIQRAALCKEPITDSVDRQEMTGCGGIRLKLLPQTAHVCVHGSGVGVGIIAPGGIQDCIALVDDRHFE